MPTTNSNSTQFDRLAGTQFIVSRSLVTSTRAGQLLDGDESVLAEIRVWPRVLWGCLTVLVSVALFFGLPLLTGWLVHQALVLKGSSLLAVCDRNLWLGVPLIIAILATGVLGAMSASWSLYRQKWQLVDDRQLAWLSLIETGKYGASSLTVAVHDSKGSSLGTVHRDIRGEVMLFNSDGLACLHLLREGSALRQAGREGLLAVLTGAIAFVVAMFLGSALVIAFHSGRVPYRILRVQRAGIEPGELVGSILPVEPRARRVAFTRPLDPTEKTLVMSAVVILTMYDY